MGDRAVVDKQSCLSSGRCLQAEPRAFVEDEDHLAEATAAARELSRERLVEIARSCPSIAITVLDDDGNEVDLGRSPG
ncbi:MAG: ferredoxin [Proteobacteria bacterium]|nr:ferredoxin [Pseudomonadota bacterium]